MTKNVFEFVVKHNQKTCKIVIKHFKQSQTCHKYEPHVLAPHMFALIFQFSMAFLFCFSFAAGGWVTIA